MNISIELPQDIEQQLLRGGVDPIRDAKEVYLMEQYRQAKITHRQLQEALDQSFHETEQLLKHHGLGQDLDTQEFDATTFPRSSSIFSTRPPSMLVTRRAWLLRT